MAKDTGDILKKDGCIWEIIRYDQYEDCYICHRLDTFSNQIKKFREEDMEDL